MDIQHVREPLSVVDSDLRGSHFSATNLAQARFTDVNLGGAHFADVDLRGGAFENVALADATIRDADLRGSHFSATNLAQARFTDVNLGGARFADVGLRGAAFENVALAGATIRDADLSGVTIEDANCDGLRIDGMAIQDLLRMQRQRAGAVLFCTDVARVQAFYEAVAGLAVEHRGDDHVVLGTPAFELIVHRARGDARTPDDVKSHDVKSPDVVAPSESPAPPQPRTETSMKLVLPVADLAAARRTALAHGGGLLPPEREWDYANGRACDGHDPEGNIVQFRQFPA